MRAWLQRLHPRERAVVLGAGAAALALALYVLAIEPAWERLQNERARLESQQSLLEWMQRSAAEVQQLRGSGAGGQRSDKAPYLIVDSAVRRSGMPAPARLEPRGRDGATVQFDNVSFDLLVRMLGEIERQGELSISDLSVTRRGPGTVSASLSVNRLQ